ncbi:MAG: DUF6460 domain-containing protein [Parvibaculum sp.]
MDRFFGGPVVPTILKLAIASIAVGVVLAVFGIKPIDLWRDFLDTIANIWAMGFDALDWSVQYLLLGAVVVIPIFVAVRLWNVLMTRGKKE